MMCKLLPGLVYYLSGLLCSKDAFLLQALLCCLLVLLCGCQLLLQRGASLLLNLQLLSCACERALYCLGHCQQQV